MPLYKIYIGSNCHADVVVEGAERHPETLDQAKSDFSDMGFDLSPEAIIGHFCVLGSDYDQGSEAHLTPEELNLLSLVGEVNPQS